MLTLNIYRDEVIEVRGVKYNVRVTDKYARPVAFDIEGRVFECKNGRWFQKNATLKSNGRCKVHFRNKGAVKGDKKAYPEYLIHRLIAEAFIFNPRNLTEVDHINRDPTDNRVSNLKWVTHRENCNNRSTFIIPDGNVPLVYKADHDQLIATMRAMIEEYYNNHPRI